MSKETKQDYYVNAFKKLEEEGKHTWNWAACMCGAFWMLYRKMYLYGFLLVVFNIAYLVLSLQLASSVSSSVMIGLSFMSAIITSSLLGFFGNALYYRVVKKRIKKGYHLMDRYHSTTVSMLVVDLFTYGLGYFLVNPFYALADRIANRNYFKTHELADTEINEENIRMYLTNSKKDHVLARVAKTFAVILGLLVPVSFIAMRAIGEKIVEQLDREEKNRTETRSSTDTEQITSRTR